MNYVSTSKEHLPAVHLHKSSQKSPRLRFLMKHLPFAERRLGINFKKYEFSDQIVQKDKIQAF